MTPETFPPTVRAFIQAGEPEQQDVTAIQVGDYAETGCPARCECCGESLTFLEDHGPDTNGYPVDISFAASENLDACTCREWVCEDCAEDFRVAGRMVEEGDDSSDAASLKAALIDWALEHGELNVSRDGYRISGPGMEAIRFTRGTPAGVLRDALRQLGGCGVAVIDMTPLDPCGGIVNCCPSCGYVGEFEVLSEGYFCAECNSEFDEFKQVDRDRFADEDLEIAALCIRRPMGAVS